MSPEVAERAKALESLVNVSIDGVKPRQQRAKLEETAKLLLGGWTWLVLENFGEAPWVVITGLRDVG